MSVCEEFLVPFYFFSFLIVFLFLAQDSLVSVLITFIFTLDPYYAILTLYVNTTLFPSFTLTNLFLARNFLSFPYSKTSLNMTTFKDTQTLSSSQFFLVYTNN